jgi:hypothetical protein
MGINPTPYHPCFLPRICCLHLMFYPIYSLRPHTHILYPINGHAHTLYFMTVKVDLCCQTIFGYPMFLLSNNIFLSCACFSCRREIIFQLYLKKCKFKDLQIKYPDCKWPISGCSIRTFRRRRWPPRHRSRPRRRPTETKLANRRLLVPTHPIRIWHNHHLNAKRQNIIPLIWNACRGWVGHKNSRIFYLFTKKLI